MSKDFSKFKKEIKNNKMFYEFQIEEGKDAKVYKAKTTNRELLLFQEVSNKEYKDEVDRTIDLFKVFLGEKDGLEVFNKLTPQGIEEVILVLICEVSGVSIDEMKEYAKELNSPSE